MRYTRAREWLARRMRDSRSGDMRNPYGSRGGYVVSDKRGRDYGGMDYNVRDREYGSRDYHWTDEDYAQGGRYGQSNRQYSRDNGYDMRGRSDYEYDSRRGDRDYNYDMRRGDYNYDRYYGYDGRRDYSSEDYKLTPREIHEWEDSLINPDGTRGGKFSVDQIRQMAQQYGIKFDEFSPELLTAVTNAVYSDYDEVVHGDLATYMKMGKAFLCDKDFDGTPEEKAYLYYTAIASQED